MISASPESLNPLNRFSKAFILTKKTEPQKGNQGLFPGSKRQRLHYAPISLSKIRRFTGKTSNGTSLCEELADVGEGFELERIACGVEKEHGRLLPDFALEADLGLDDEGDAGAAKAICQRFPCVHWEHNPEVWNGNVVAVDGILVSVADTVVRGGLEVRDDLMTEEVEVYPVCGAAALGTA